VKIQADPRRVVLDLLLSPVDFPTRQFGAAANKAGLGAKDRGLARQILAGVLRHSYLLDAIFEPYCRKRVTDPALRWALRMGTFQLFFLSNVPAHAAVHATIQAARPSLRELTGFGNAVLRNLQRHSQLEEPFQTERTRSRLQVGKRSWHFDRKLFKDAAISPIEFWATELSFPLTLARRWFESLGAEAAIARMQALNQIPPLWLRVNLARASKAQVRQALESDQVEVHDHSHPRMLRLHRPGRDISKLAGYAEGWWSVQDLTSLRCLELADPQPGERVLDLCAAPGGKSFATAELTSGQAQIFATDLIETRLARIEPEAQRLGHQVRCQTIPEQGPGLPEGPFDLILLDVPCTNSGVLNKRLEARAGFHKDQVHQATTIQNLIRKRVQKAYLSPELGANRPRVLWTTCSLEPEENQQMVARMAKQAHMTIASEMLVEPDGLQAGGFGAILEPKP
jgi:16S rRNA (cytosine967-C5)-methyltransferase